MEIRMPDWEPGIHDTTDQIQRIVASQTPKIKKGIVEINKERGYVRIQGSAGEPYFTTLSECNCVDFCVRGLPCKHMYALADEMGLLEGYPKYDKNSDFDAEQEEERYRQLFLDGKIKGDDFVKLCKVLDKM